VSAQGTHQWCGSMKFWLLDPEADPDPAIFVSDLQDANKKLIVKKRFSCLSFLKVHYETVGINVFLTVFA